MIEGVTTKRLRLLVDERGWLMEILRNDWDVFDRFGQVYVTAAYPNVVKAWHMHKKQTDHVVLRERLGEACSIRRQGWNENKG